MLVLVGPSASGKTEVARILIEKYQMKRMITYTTRDIRVGEENGVSYHFIGKEEFLKLKENDEFVETVFYNNNYYGTRKSDVAIDKIVILEPQGVKVFKEKMSNEVIIFYLKTRETERINRMIYRQDKLEDIQKRVDNDRMAFENIDGIDYYMENENITLEDLADNIYKLYKKEK